MDDGWMDLLKNTSLTLFFCSSLYRVAVLQTTNENKKNGLRIQLIWCNLTLWKASNVHLRWKDDIFMPLLAVCDFCRTLGWIILDGMFKVKLLFFFPNQQRDAQTAYWGCYKTPPKQLEGAVCDSSCPLSFLTTVSCFLNDLLVM